MRRVSRTRPPVSVQPPSSPSQVVIAVAGAGVDRHPEAGRDLEPVVARAADEVDLRQAGVMGLAAAQPVDIDTAVPRRLRQGDQGIRLIARTTPKVTLTATGCTAGMRLPERAPLARPATSSRAACPRDSRYSRARV